MTINFANSALLSSWIAFCASTGDANCSLCHMVGGKGGRLGPDLSSVGGSRTHDALVDAVRNPSRRLAWGLTESTKEFPQEYESATEALEQLREISERARTRPLLAAVSSSEGALGAARGDH